MKYFCLFLIAIFLSCSTPKADTQSPSADSTVLETTPEPGSVRIRDMSRFPDIKNQNNLNKIIRELETAECVNESSIGFAGEYSRTFALFERLKQLATELQLNALLKNKNAVVRVYSFRALKELKYPTASQAKTSLDNDTTMVCWFIGCNKLTVPVNSFSKSEE